MTARRLLLATLLASALAAALIGAAVSLILAALAVLEPRMGALGGAALIALVIAALLALCALMITPRNRPRRGAGRDEASRPFLERVWIVIKEHPLLLSGLGGVIVLLALFNPRYLLAGLRAYLHEQRASR